MIPGVNLLAVAMQSIAPDTVEYMAGVGRTIGPAGAYVPTFAAPVTIEVGSVQAVPRTSYAFMGLDMSKKYVNWFVPREVFGLERDGSGDRFETQAGELYQIENTTDWALQDGWVQALAVKVPRNA